ncbi:SUN domain-containing protein 2-like isoform X1 [Thunnus maccoyii]|uniref:SUN domain-containing protein 2-like isoform X1 n=1 Tax=Thunnus maccoyii TaxID=8240 RepID=UPI001C4C6075|nr:SUN domain-containing protein 2-like isoform X1 [Thunnus maccoyii]XP_042252995.1 SUN domain-containing protein 2-like isoform X1 [Thunnus maccoyii]
MSRRSLRLDDGLLDRSLPHCSASFSVGGSSWRSSRSLKSRRSQQLSVSCSESLLGQTPRKAAGPSLLNSSLHSVASDASLLSSLLDESSVQETTLVNTFWGLDQDVDPKESTVIAEPSSVLANSTLIGCDGRCPKQPVQTHSRVYCRDCESDRKEPATAFTSSSSKYTSTSTSSSSSMGPGRPEPRDPDTSTVYGRDRIRKSRTAGVLVSVWDAGVNVSRRSAACLVWLLTLLYHQLLLQKPQDVTDVLQLWLDSSLLCVRRAAARCASVMTHTRRVCRGLASKVTEVNTQTENRHAAGFGHCGDMNLKEWKQRERHPDGSLCDDCKEKRRGSETDNVSSSSSSWWSSSSVASCLLGLTWSATVFTGKTAGEVFRRLSRRWRHMTTSFLLTRFPLRLFLVLLPLLLLFSLCWFGPAGLQSVLPAVNITDWRTAVSDIPALSSIYSIMSSQSQSAGGAMEESREVQTHVGPLYSRTPPAETPTGEEEESAAADDDSVRLVLLEQSLTALWERVEAGGQRAEQRHREVLRMYTDLQQQQQQQLVSVQSSVGEGTEPWLSGLLDQQLSQLRRRLDEERRQREQIRQQDLVQQQSQTSRLDQLELQLQTLAAKTEQVHRRQEAATTVSPSPSTLPAAVSVGVDRQSHDALLAEVARLEAALEDVRRDVEGLSGCRDGCRGLDRIQQTISAQVSSRVRKDVRALIYGNQLTVGGGASGDTAALPESLLQWLSQQYVSGADLQAALASLELSILQNISLQLQQQHRSEEMVSEAVLHAAGAAGAAVTQEEVHMIVKNALRLFSQDRTGLADYALESGGGSVLSTRCSETYETKAALLSLFGVPLWYFSQSPRAVIQPDVHPGNCWAFRGSTGFLVIRLSMKILPTAFSLEHIPKSLAPSGTLHSAPRDFNVYGLDEESQERGKLLGTYTYDEDGEALQTYSVTEENDQTFQIIEVQVLSNWGHQEYTCMYRFRVHGTPQS